MATARRQDVRPSLVLRGLPGVGPVRFKEIVEAFGSAADALATGGRELGRWIGSKGLAALRAGRPRRDADVIVRRCRDLGIEITALGLGGYPNRLGDLPDPPPVLYWKGRLQLLEASCVAVVGSRRATAYGRRVARKLGRFLAESGRPVLSGMALG
ncbi:MAG: DNA-protecting protein DprA, partial [Gemmatimonadetes bacterium]|nr:DNA-protecting protein DprA [Gemmatimonadota bacterium]